ncbi:hypothetical protein GQ55_9G440300 [Panicum hallii var. hallii]|uniref:Uncharacterized protein n=1 Tax=Panicum hallii var. hallii TaxID=1504633 RepID=A0A2T7CBC2_9POAL|nr:hypothetical protein GQ55_9G440300 [Panicum hallii var. hallii]
MAAVCTVTPAATFSRAGCARERSAWNSKKPGRASASESWTKDKLAARTSSSVPGRASLSDNWIRDKAERKEIGVDRVGWSPSREISPVRAKRTLSRAPSLEVKRSEKKAKPEEDVEPVVVDKLVTRASSTVPGSSSDDCTRDKIRRKEIGVEHVGRSPREISPVRAKRTLSRAPSVEVERSEKKAKLEEDAEPVAVEYYAGPAFMKAPHPSEVPLPTFPLFVKSPDPSELPIPTFLKRTKVAAKNRSL